MRLRDRAYPTKFDAPDRSARLISVSPWAQILALSNAHQWGNIQKRRCKNNLSIDREIQYRIAGLQLCHQPAVTGPVFSGIDEDTTRGEKSLNGDNDF